MDQCKCKICDEGREIEAMAYALEWAWHTRAAAKLRNLWDRLAEAESHNEAREFCKKGEMKNEL